MTKIPLHLLVLASIYEIALSATCVQCLHPLWYQAVRSNSDLQNMFGESVCSTGFLESVFDCLDKCDIMAARESETVKIRQLTQVSDIFYALSVSNCHTSSKRDVINASCKRVMECITSTANYEHENSTSHAPFSTVFSYRCREGNENSSTLLKNQTSECLQQNSADCTDISMNRIRRLDLLTSVGIEAACEEPRRCVKYGVIFEVKPGSNCTEHYQEPAAYGPSINTAITSRDGEGFNVQTCGSDHLANIDCPFDESENSTEQTTTTERPTTTGVLDVSKFHATITVNTNSTCEQCLYPLWYQAVTSNGSHLCDNSFQEQVYECLANSQCCGRSSGCTNRPDQLYTEVLVKLADISKAFAMNNCSGNTKCSAASHTCTENLAKFYPASAPHVTVNSLACGEQELAATLQCFSLSCTSAEAAVLSSAVVAGFNSICNSKLRCMTYGNIYEYVPVSEVILQTANEDATPCAYFKRMGANGWKATNAIQKVKEGLLFNTRSCQPDWPAAVDCPAVIRFPGLA